MLLLYDMSVYVTHSFVARYYAQPKELLLVDARAEAAYQVHWVLLRSLSP